MVVIPKQTSSSLESCIITGGKCCALHIVKIKADDEELEPIAPALKGHGDYIRGICVNPVNPSIVATAGSDYTVRVWDLEEKQCVGMVQTKCWRPWCCAIDSTGTHLVAPNGVKDRGYKLSMWRLSDIISSTSPPDPYLTLSPPSTHTRAIRNVSFLPGYSTLIAALSERSAVLIYDASDLTRAPHVITPPEPLAVGPSGMSASMHHNGDHHFLGIEVEDKVSSINSSHHRTFLRQSAWS